MLRNVEKRTRREIAQDRLRWGKFLNRVHAGACQDLAAKPAEGDLPVAVRMGTADADAAYARLREAGATLHNDEVLHLDGAPPMFFFADPDGNGLVYLQDLPSSPPE